LLPALYTCAPADAVLERQFRAVRQTQGVAGGDSPHQPEVTTEHNATPDTVLGAADILKKLGIEPSPVVGGGSYAGRRRRQVDSVLERQEIAVRQTHETVRGNSLQQPTREPTDTTQTAIVAVDMVEKLPAQPTPRIPRRRFRGGYGRRRRQTQNEPSQTVTEETPTETTTEYVLPKNKYGDLSWLSRLGIKPRRINRSPGYGRKKREDTGDILIN